MAMDVEQENEKIEKVALKEAKLYNCRFCEKTYGHKRSRDLHEVSLHINNGAFKCEICQKTFNYQINLSTHMKKVHKIEKSTKHICHLWSYSRSAPDNESDVENSEHVVKDSVEEVQDLTKSAIKVEQGQENDQVDPFEG